MNCAHWHRYWPRHGPLLIDCKISSSVAAAFLEEIAPK